MLNRAISALLVAAFGIFPGNAQAQLAGNLTIEFDGLKNKQGDVCVKLFSSAKGFPSHDESAVRNQCFAITDTPLTVSFSNLPSGSYAIAVFHDENRNRDIDRTAIGIPLEGYGFSQNPVIRTSAPTFGETAFFVAGQNTAIQIQMQYFGGR